MSPEEINAAYASLCQQIGEAQYKARQHLNEAERRRKEVKKHEKEAEQHTKSIEALNAEIDKLNYAMALAIKSQKNQSPNKAEKPKRILNINPEGKTE